MIDDKSQLRIQKGPFNQAILGKGLLLSFFIFSVLISAIAVVYIKHLNRNLHIELQKLQQVRDNLHIEWSKLLLEQGTLASDARVEHFASDHLHMFLPKQNEMVVVRP